MARRPRALLVACAALLVAAGCSTDPDLERAEEQQSAEKQTVESPFGPVEIPVEPQAAMGMYTTDVDILITLGYQLADVQPIRGDGYTDFPEFFPQDALEGIDHFENYPDYDYDAMLAAAPDFILNGLGYDKKVNKKLPTIAATFSVDAFDGRNWREHFRETAEALGRLEEHDAWVATYDARVAEIRDELGDKAAGLVVGPISYDGGDLYSACYTGVECSVFEDLGLTVLPAAQRKGGEGVVLSSEQVGQLADLDLAFMLRGAGEDGEAQFDSYLEQLEENPLWRDLAVSSDDAIADYDLEMTFGSPSGQMAFLEVVAEALRDYEPVAG